MYFRIHNATVSITNVFDAQTSTKLLAQTTLRNMIGTRTLAEILGDRDGISHQMQVRQAFLRVKGELNAKTNLFWFESIGIVD